MIPQQLGLGIFSQEAGSRRKQAFSEAGLLFAVVLALMPFLSAQVEGRLANWNMDGRLGGINVPTLLARGDGDEVSLASSEVLQAGIPAAELVTFEGSGSMVQIDAWEVFVQRVVEFLEKSEPPSA
jgi:pimeloyl-ACP methyl ester carboxylesterase